MPKRDDWRRRGDTLGAQLLHKARLLMTTTITHVLEALALALGTWHLALETRDLRLETWDSGLGTWDLGSWGLWGREG